MKNAKGSEFSMKATTKRLLVLLAALLLVAAMGMTALAAEPAEEAACYIHGDVNGDGDIDSRDAIRTLFYVLWNDSVSVNQDCDFNADQTVTQKDAIYLLFVSLGMDGYESKGTVHSYLEPVWHWETAGAEPTATVSLKCACGTPHPVTEGITVTAGEKKDPTCVADGFKKYTAKVTYDGAEYENTTTIAVPATGDGHSFAFEPTCEAGVKCLNCDFTKPALGHSYALFGEKTEGCKHVKQYKCAACGNVIDGTAESDVYYTHTYTAELTKEATCSAAGEQTLTCGDCGDVQKEALPINESFHVWNEGVKEGNVTTYTCKHNASHTKTVVEMSDTGVSAQALKENEVKLDDAGTSVSLDEETAKQLGEAQAVKITVSEVDKDNLVLDEEKKEQIGNAKVYDFSMLSDNNAVSEFDGFVTVSLPYELQSGEDVNDIDVWFIDDEGNVTSQEGVYNNGFVTFQVEHFSYYTVTRMTPAERCARYGHNMIEQNKAATCTEDGYAKKFCLRCGQVEKDEKLPMLGHDYKVDAKQSVAATCASHGTEVSVCANCNDTKTEELKQLSHDWKKTESVAATCTAKGYDKSVCQLCKEEKIENEQPALGHSYQVNEAGWQWSDDHSKASVTLKCENEGCTAQKALEAVITKKLDGSVCLGGEATYTATVSHNNKTFTDTATGKEAGAGQHSPNAKWETTDTQHYQLCAVCGEKVGIADHDWVQTVTQKPTCDKSGKATETCSVCDKEREVILPATGEHDMVNGVCSVCGYTEGTCQHKTLKVTKIDLAQYGACAGTVEIKSCDCGKVNIISNTDLSCELENTSEESESGDLYYNKSVCKVCGLVGETTDKRVINESSCTASWVSTVTISKDGVVIAQTTNNDSYTYQHPTTVKHAPINLADYGLCAGKLTQTTCPCGLRSSWVYEEGGCQWVEGKDGYDAECTVCGATAKVTTAEKKDGCTYSEEEKTTLFKDGKQVLEIVTRYAEVVHDYEVETINRYGETCEDGFYAVRVCTVCGEKNAAYYEWCSPMVETKRIDTSNVGSCSTALVICTCPCGRESTWYYEGDSHDWRYDYNPETGEHKEYCAKCGFYIVTEREEADPAQKDENCCVEYLATHTYRDDKGHSFTFELTGCEYFHKFQRSFKLLGESCEDGVEVIETCADCDLHSQWTDNYHQEYLTTELDLSDQGFCGGTVRLYACPCGQQSYVDGNYACQWEGVAGDENYEESVCRICGIHRVHMWKELETDHSCITPVDNTYTYYKGETVLGSLKFRQTEEHHRYVYELVLNEGATSCEGGWQAFATCLECGDTYETWGNGCSRYPVERKIISAEGMCGVLDQLTERCACGKYEDTTTQWVSKNHCDFYTGNEEYSESYGGWKYTCPVCGFSRISTGKTEAIEGDLCHMLRVEKTYFLDPDGKEVAVTENEYKVESHDWLYTYSLKGQTCADGWTYSIKCADCGLEEVYDHEVNTHCEVNAVSREVVYDAEDICGPVYLLTQSCACGAQKRYDVTDACENGSSVGGTFTCSDCGLAVDNLYRYEHIPGTCRETVEMTYTISRDGKQVAQVVKTYEQEDHIAVFSFKMNGTTCEEGYEVYQNCMYCDYSEFHGQYSGHHTYRTAYYAMPEGSCGGEIHVYSCPCKQQQRIEFSEGYCQFTGTSGTATDENGIEYDYQNRKCTKCGLESKQQWYYTEGSDACHQVLHQNYSWTLGDWNVQLEGSSETTRHDYEYVAANLAAGVTSCEDGVNVTSRCTQCGWEYTSTFTGGHPTVVVETMDLAQYGAVCGAKLQLKQCACGMKKGYEFSHDTKCDLDEKNIPHFVEGTIDDNQFTADGEWTNTWSSSFTYTCAVTEPKCGLSIRMSTYWLEENCIATEYETWQLGYDATTGTCAKEITIATGRKSVNHDYKYSGIDETVDGQSVSGSKFTCSKCGSYYTELSYYENGRQAKFVRQAVNLLDNGGNKQYTQTWDRGYHNDIQYTSRQRDEWVTADGSTQWRQWDYTYDFAAGCLCTEVYTASDGGYNSHTVVYHNTQWDTEWIKHPTCTQAGSYIERSICQFCETVENEYRYTADPTAHSWNWSEDLQTYVCGTCGMESVNGASGSIVMEDLTQETGTDYVIGYWNRGTVSFNPYVSLVLYDAAEGENDELVLDSVSVKYLTVEADGICGLSFSKAETAAAASAALKSAGYTGTYAVRITCVPAGGTELDYAVTFETLTAE